MSNDGALGMLINPPTDLFDQLEDACPPEMDIRDFYIQLLRDALDLRRMMKTIIGRSL